MSVTPASAQASGAGRDAPVGFPAIRDRLNHLNPVAHAGGIVSAA
ncbi:hypothetical protein [Tabrizicola soli]|uniref:Uncharacterized protein n=1 Tax=Tabrizicola soli TaxID=2185115 RepID=A0ABV7DRN5_9RHOB|nr:hypothetical protein [Tabrizicola soli]